ncbi:iron ABC transporter permease [Agromyces mediolanus]|uniref:FecCD family ABC transporter permease n=1 Tax=Agromyces mediolanus TaxID=41986 RepID=UPI0038399265
MTTAVVAGRAERLRPALVVPAGIAVIALLAMLGLSAGTPWIAPADALRLLVEPDGSQASIILHTLRLPRVLLAVAAGAALAVAGVVMQALTRNPLADPGILGVNAGAAFAVAFAVVVLDLQAFGATLGFAFVGAAIAGLLVALLGGAGRSSSIARLALAGVAVGAVLSGFTQALSLLDPADYAAIRIWEAGSLAARDVPTALGALAVIAVGLALALAAGPGLNLLVLGEEAAHGLGARVARVRTQGLVAIVLLCGTATAAIGPVAFVGLLVPHAVRALTGADQIRALWYSAIAGPALLLAADLVARLAVAPRELPLGVVTAILGAPVLVLVVQRRRRVGA